MFFGGLTQNKKGSHKSIIVFTENSNNKRCLSEEKQILRTVKNHLLRSHCIFSFLPFLVLKSIRLVSHISKSIIVCIIIIDA